MSPGMTHNLLLRAPYLITMLGVALRASASSIDPAVLGLNPWHEHVVVGARDPHAYVHALRHHTHDGQLNSPRSAAGPAVPGGQALVVSIVDQVRALLNSLSASGNEALLAPGLWLPLVYGSISLLCCSLVRQRGSIGSLAPPTPPPRPID